MQVVVKAKTVEEAVEIGAKKLGKDVSEVDFHVIGEGKKGFLGMFSAEAEVMVYCDGDVNETEVLAEDQTVEASELTKASETTQPKAVVPENLPPVQEKIVEFLNTIISDMGVDAKASVVRIDERMAENSSTIEKDIHIEIAGKGLGILIGRHGDVLDSLQYLCNIIVGRYPKSEDKHEYIRIVLDIENYREKRAETLRTLARRVASKVVASGRSFTLEPMSAYERRIIHSEVQEISGVHTYSIGTESNRRVVIAYGEDINNIEE